MRPSQAALGAGAPAAAVAGAFAVLFVALYRGQYTVVALELAVMVIAGAWLIGSQDWRRLFFFLLAYLPYSGVISLLAYPQTLLGEVVRDLGLLLPLYVALLPRASTAPRLPPSVVFAVGALAGLVLTQALNPSVSSAAVAAVGARGWLIAVPLLWVGARLAARPEDVRRWMRISSVAAVPVLLIGIVEAVMLAFGGASIVAAAYGDAAAVAFGERGVSASFAIGGGELRRVPSLFAFPLAYYALCIASLVPTYVLWRTSSGGWRRFGAVAFVVAVVAGLSSGTRLAFILVPAAVIVIFLFDRRLTLRSLALSAGSWLAVLFTLGINPRALPEYFRELSSAEGGDVLVGGFRLARSVTTLGLGTGMDTNASRQVDANVFAPIGHDWQESYLVKTWLELGVLGIVVVAGLFLVLVLWLLRLAVLPGGGDAQPLRAGVLAFVTVTLLLSVKGSPLDQAPTNYFFWLYAGMALGTLRRVTAPAAPETVEAAPR